MRRVAVEVVWGSQTRETTVELGEGDARYAVLHAARAELPGGFAAVNMDQVTVLLPDDRPARTDEDLRGLREGSKLKVVLPAQASGRVEAVQFTPHPNTVIMAGDLEYFESNGAHPLAYALAELIDNAMRATRDNREARNIDVSFVLGPNDQGVIYVEDNGCGMDMKALNQWAIMGLSMEDRGERPVMEEPPGLRGAASHDPGRFLSSDLSFFGVGSKNAVFYLGSCVKMVTRAKTSSQVLELAIRADELRDRHHKGENPYQGQITFRDPGDDSTLLTEEARLQAARERVAREASAGPAFTRVIITNLKDRVLDSLRSEHSDRVCRHLAHLYHYYLHGSQGNVADAPPAKLPGGQVRPTIRVQFIEQRQGRSEVVWSHDLREVQDDLETRYLRNKKSTLHFAYDVPDKGTVEGVLWYFPYDHDRETLPVDDTVDPKPPSQQAQRPHARPDPSRLSGAAARHSGAGSSGHGAADDDDDDEVQIVNTPNAPSEPQRGPIFELFWQGRLIPGAHLDSLPFIDETRMGRSATDRDDIPDAVFLRIRGALFLGPAFGVTRNKLTFRDNIAELLKDAPAKDRNLQKHFKRWLKETHQKEDKVMVLKGIADPEQQEEIRKTYKGRTLYNRVVVGGPRARQYKAGDCVQVHTKPIVVGVVKGFLADKIHEGDLDTGSGFVLLNPVPTPLHAKELKDFPITRIVKIVTDEERRAYEEAQLKKLPSQMDVHFWYRGPDKEEAVDKRKKVPTNGVTVKAGSKLPGMLVAVTDGHGKAAKRKSERGLTWALQVKQVGFRVINKRSGVGADGGRARATRTQPQRAAAPRAEGEGEDRAEGAREEAWELVNNHPYKENLYYFEPKQMKETGVFIIEHVVELGIEGVAPIKHSTTVRVTGANPTAVRLGGPGVEHLAKGSPMLLETMPDIVVEFMDEFDNPTALPDTFDAASLALRLAAQGPEGPAEILRLEFESCEADVEKGTVTLRAPRVAGDEARAEAVRSVFHASKGKGTRAQVTLSVSYPSMKEDQLGFDLLSGPPEALRLEESHGARNADPSSARNADASDAGNGAAGSGAGAGAGEGGRQRGPAGAVKASPAAVGAGTSKATAAATVTPTAKGSGAAGKGSGAAKGSSAAKAAGAAGLAGGGAGGGPASEGDAFALEVDSGAASLMLSFLALDRYGNRATLRSDLDACLCLSSPLLAPGPGAPDGAPLLPVEFSDSAVATVRDLSFAPVPEGASVAVSDNAVSVSALVEAWIDFEGPVPETFAHVYPGTTPHRGAKRARASGAAEGAGGRETTRVGLLRGRLTVTPSTDPATMTVHYQGQPLPCTPKAIEEGADPIPVFEMPGAFPVATTLDRVTLHIVDEAGRIVPKPLSGDIKVSWDPRNAIPAEPTMPLSWKLPEEICALAPVFTIDFYQKVGKRRTSRHIRVGVQVRLSPGPPHQYALSFENPESADLQNGQVRNGEVARIEVQIFDQYYNPTPPRDDLPERELVALLLESSIDDPLPCPYSIHVLSEAWCKKSKDAAEEGGNQADQAVEEDVVMYRVKFSGPPGKFKVGVRDRSGPNGASRFLTDDVQVEMLPGAPCRLEFSGPPQLRRPVRCRLEGLSVRVVDEGGSLCSHVGGAGWEGRSVEVLLSNAALEESGGGLAAKVGCAGGNRVAVVDGVAVLPPVTVSADRPGTYLLDAELRSRDLPNVERATLRLVLEPRNACTGLRVDPGSVGRGVEAGQAAVVAVAVQTEDGRPLDSEAASAGLRLAITPPSGRKADVFHVLPEAIEAGGIREARFCVQGLTKAGKYGLIAEFKETRADLARKKEATIRSSAAALLVSPGPADTVALLSGATPHRACTNRGGGGARVIAEAPIFEARDAHGNALPGGAAAGQMRVRVGWARGPSQAPPGALLPRITVNNEELPDPNRNATDGPVDYPEIEADEVGRFVLGPVMVVEGTGQMGERAVDGASQPFGMEFVVDFEWRPPGQDYFKSAYTVEVAVCDDEHRAREVQRTDRELASLTTKRDRLLQEAKEMEEKHETAKRALERFNREIARLARDVEAGAPATAEECAEMAGRIKAELASSRRPYRPPRIEGSRWAPVRRTIESLEAHPPIDGVMGFMVRLFAIDDPQLARVLSAHIGPTKLATLVVNDFDARRRADAVLRGPKGTYMPDRFVIQGALRGKEAPGELQESAPPHVRQLHEDASLGTDPILAYELPHQLAMRNAGLTEDAARQKCEQANAAFIDPDAWPEGLLGYVANLIRPLRRELRAKVLWPIFGKCMLFDRLENAEKYRGLCVALGVGTGELLCMTGDHMTASGIIRGSSGGVDVSRDPDVMLGSTAAGEGAEDMRKGRALEALESLQEALEEMDRLKKEEEEAREAVEGRMDETMAEVNELETRIESLKAKLGVLQGRAPAGAEGAGEGGAMVNGVGGAGDRAGGGGVGMGVGGPLPMAKAKKRKGGSKGDKGDRDRRGDGERERGEGSKRSRRA